MPSENTLDDIVDRLTEREKEPLRLWLNHKSAKEIALELGISHHAVEKRLKMARAKLGVASSLEAARMLAEAEGYGQTVTYTPDLGEREPRGQTWRSKPIVIGATVMSFSFATVLLAFASSGTAELEVKPGDLLLLAAVSFADLDEDKSGFLEGNETPPLIVASGNPAYVPNGDGTAELSGDQFVITNAPMRESFYKQADTDRDGRVSPAEFDAWAKPQSAFAKTNSNKRLGQMTRRTFDALDADSSGYLERPESPFIGLAFTTDGNPTAAEVAKALGREIAKSPDDKQLREFFGEADRNHDGKISYAEYHEWSVPRLAELGFDFITALQPES